MKKLFIFLISLTVLSCTNRNKIPEGILKPDKMQLVLWDYINADVFVTDYISQDTSRDARMENVILQKKIFRKHNISKEQFYKSYEYYVDHADLMGTTLDSMIQKQRRILNAKKKDKQSKYE